ncbi:MAG: DUF938 domain-containing protein [Pseudomonadota bacterium]
MKIEGFSTAAENNKAPILSALQLWLKGSEAVLEVGSGAGQHAIHFAAAFPSLRWQPTEQAPVLSMLAGNIERHAGPNVLPPLELDLERPWPDVEVDCVYSANVIHIVPIALGEALIEGAAGAMKAGGTLLIYGPFKYDGEFTTASNADFDVWLKTRDSRSGVRDIEWVCDCAAQSGLSLVEDRSMPANNQFLRFELGDSGVGE